MKTTLHRFQKQAVEHIMRPETSTLMVQSPVASGKTLIFAESIKRFVTLGQKVVVLAHRRELIDQAAERVSALGLKYGVVRSGAPHLERPDAPVQIASVQTLARRGHRPEAQVIIVDEAHHTPAKSYRKILNHYPNARVIGFSATPHRNGQRDVTSLSELFSEIYTTIQPEVAVEKGYLAPIEGRVFVPPSLSDVAKTKGDFDLAELGEAMSRRHIVGDIVRKWKARARGASTILFAATCSQSEIIVKAFRKAGVKAESLDGETRPEVRASTLARFRAGEFKVLCNVGLFTEGTNIECIKCVILARPTYSLTLYLQMVGRGRRVWKDKTCVIHDHGGLIAQHGLPDLDRDWELGGRGSGAATIVCPKCKVARSIDVSKCPTGCKFPGHEVADPAWIPHGYDYDMIRFAEMQDAKRAEAMRLYVEERKSSEEVGKILSLSHSKILDWARKGGWVRTKAEGLRKYNKDMVEKVVKLYTEKKRTARGLGVEFGVSPGTVRRWVEEAGYKPRTVKEARAPDPALIERVRQLYVEERKSGKETALTVGLSLPCVLMWMKKLGVHRSHTAARKTDDKIIGRARKLYVEDSKTPREVGAILGIRPGTIKGWMRELGCLRSRREAAKLNANKPPEAPSCNT